jgi:hypothetical protein
LQRIANRYCYFSTDQARPVHPPYLFHSCG